MKDYELEAVAALREREIYTEYTTDEPGEGDQAVTIRLLAVLIWRTVRHIEQTIAETPPGEGITADRAAAMISQAVGDLTDRIVRALVAREGG